MKRILIIFLFAAMISSLYAQATRLGDFSTRGAVSQEMRIDGLVGAHASLPLNSVVKITNPQNGKEAEITIIGRIEPSQKRLIDISAATAEVLELKPGDEAVITVGAPPRPITQPPRQPEPIIDLYEPVLITPPVPLEPSLSEVVGDKTISGQEPVLKDTQAPERIEQAQAAPAPEAQAGDAYYPDFTVADPAMKDAFMMSGGGVAGADGSNDAEFLAWLMAMTMEARDARDARDSRDAREAREVREIREDRAVREARESRASRETREARELREAKEAREAREARERAEIAAAARRQAPAPQRTAPAPQPTAQAPRPQNQNNPVPINNQLQTDRPLINLPPTDKQVSDNNRAINLNDFEPVSSAPQNSDLRVSANQSQAVNRTPAPVQGLQPVKPENLKITPGLPDRHSGKVYKLQIGAFSSIDTANKTAATLKNAGFYAEIETVGSVYRVLAAKISSSDVYPACVRLGALGYGQIWVRE